MTKVTSTVSSLNHIQFEIRNYQDENSFIDMTMASLCMIVFIACGFWCICASCQLNKEDGNSYHKDNEFEKDEENPPRSKAGLEVVHIDT